MKRKNVGDYQVMSPTSLGYNSRSTHYKNLHGIKNLERCKLSYISRGKSIVRTMLNQKRVDAFSIKSGPTESGGRPTGPPREIVGGEIFSVDTLSVFLSQNWLLLVLLIPFGFLLYKKRSMLSRLIIRTNLTFLKIRARF